jgi:hypothetical protein
VSFCAIKSDLKYEIVSREGPAALRFEVGGKKDRKLEDQPLRSLDE